MTGRYPHNSGVYFLSPDLKSAPVLKNLKTLPEVFAEQGYKTLAAGKIFTRAIVAFFRNIYRRADSVLAPRKRFPNLMVTPCGTGESFRTTTT